jgi:hypothetical protein
LPAGERPVFRRWSLAAAVAALAVVSAAAARSDAPARTFPPLPATMTVPNLPAWLQANTDIPPASLVAFVRGVATVLLDPDAAGSGGHHSVVVRREAMTDSASEVIGGRSEFVRLEVDCTASAYRLTARSVYSGNSLTGSAQVMSPNAPMAAVPPNTDLSFLLRAVCNPGYQPPLAPYMASAPATPPAAAPMPARAAQTPAPAAQPPPVLVARRQTPPPAPPPAQPAAPVAQPPAPVAPARTLVAQQQQPSALAAHTAPRPIAPTGKFVAQVSASASEALAHKLLADLTRRVPEVAAMPTSVDRVRVKDAVLFRVSITGFQTSSTAEAFCVRLRSASYPCWVR